MNNTTINRQKKINTGEETKRMMLKKLIQVGILLIVLSSASIANAKEPETLICADNRASYNEAMKYYLMIPEFIRSEVEQLDYQIIITPDTDIINRIAMGVSYQNPTATIVAAVIESESTIYVWDNKKYIKHLIHEIGHVYSDILDHLGGEYPYERETFQNAYQNEGRSLGGYAAGDICEYYAEAFMYYCTQPASLKELAPKTYECLVSDLTAYESSLSLDVRRGQSGNNDM